MFREDITGTAKLVPVDDAMARGVVNREPGRYRIGTKRREPVLDDPAAIDARYVLHCDPGP